MIENCKKPVHFFDLKRRDGLNLFYCSGLGGSVGEAYVYLSFYDFPFHCRSGGFNFD